MKRGSCYDQRLHWTIHSHILPTYAIPYSIFTFLLSSILFYTLLLSSFNFYSIYDVFFILVYIDSIYTVSDSTVTVIIVGWLHITRKKGEFRRGQVGFFKLFNNGGYFWGKLYTHATCTVRLWLSMSELVKCCLLSNENAADCANNLLNE